MYKGDASRKSALIDHGFRLPRAADNRPLKAEEFRDQVGQWSSSPPPPATGSTLSQRGRRADRAADRGRRPRNRGAGDGNQMDDLMSEIKRRAEAGERVLTHADQADGRRPHGLFRSSTGSRSATCTRKSTLSSGSRSFATCGTGITTCWSESTCCGRGSICRRFRSWRSSMPIKKGFCGGSDPDPDDRSRGPPRRGKVMIYADRVTDACGPRS